MTKVNINVQRIAQSAQQAHKEVAIAIHNRAIQVISEPGYFDGFPQDIVDTGRLRGSQEFPRLEGNAYVLRNTVDYAQIVYFGATFNAGESWMVKEHERKIKQAFGRPISPTVVKVRAHMVTRANTRVVEGRPWMRAAAEDLDGGKTAQEFFAQRMKEILA